MTEYYKTMQQKEDVTTQIREAAKNTTLQELSDRTGLDKSNLSKMLSGKSNPSIDNLLKVTNALGKKIEIR